MRSHQTKKLLHSEGNYQKKKKKKKRKERKKERKKKRSPTNRKRYLQITHVIRGYYAKHIKNSYNSK